MEIPLQGLEEAIGEPDCLQVFPYSTAPRTRSSATNSWNRNLEAKETAEPSAVSFALRLSLKDQKVILPIFLGKVVHRHPAIPGFPHLALDGRLQNPMVGA